MQHESDFPLEPYLWKQFQIYVIGILEVRFEVREWVTFFEAVWGAEVMAYVYIKLAQSRGRSGGRGGWVRRFSIVYYMHGMGHGKPVSTVGEKQSNKRNRMEL